MNTHGVGFYLLNSSLFDCLFLLVCKRGSVVRFGHRGLPLPHEHSPRIKLFATRHAACCSVTKHESAATKAVLSIDNFTMLNLHPSPSQLSHAVASAPVDMASPIGLTVGDLVVGCQVLIEIKKALVDVKESSAEYDSTMNDLQMVQHILRSIETLQSTGDKDSILQGYVEDACRPVAKFLDKRRARYDCTMTPEEQVRISVGNVLHSLPKRLKWALCVKKEAAKVKNEVVTRFAVINLYLSLQTKRNTDETRHDVDRIR